MIDWFINLIRLTAAQLAGEPISLPPVKFNNIFNMQLFVVDNQDDSDVTEIQVSHPKSLNSRQLDPDAGIARVR